MRWLTACYRQFDQSGSVLDRSNHGQTVSNCTFSVYPGRGRVLVVPPAGLTAGQTQNYWDSEASFNWTYANRPGVKLTASVNGKFSQYGLATSIYQNGQWRVIVDSSRPGAGQVVHVRGVYPVLVEFSWDNYWAEAFETPTNYYASHTNGNNQTVITLTGYPGSGQVQLWYAYNTGVEASRYQQLNIWPIIKDWQSSSGDKVSMWAVDKVLELYHYLWLEEQYTGKSTAAERQFLWQQYRQYTPLREPPLILDNYRRTQFERGNTVLFRNSTRGNSYPVFRDWGIKPLPDSNQPALHYKVYLGQSDAAWAGYYLGINDLSEAPWNTVKNGVIKVTYTGSRGNGRLLLQLNRARWSDEDKFTNPAYIYVHGLPEWQESWTTEEIDYKQFWRMDNLIADFDRLKVNLWGYSGSGPMTPVEFRRKFTVADEVFYTSAGLRWNGAAGNWVLLGIGGQQIDLTGQTSLNFLFKTNYEPVYSSYASEGWTTAYKMEVKQEGDASYRTAFFNYSSPGSWQRITLNFSSFSPAIDPDKKIVEIQILVLTLGLTNSGLEMQVADIKCGSHKTFYDEGDALYLIQFYTQGVWGGQQSYWIKELAFGPDADDPYPYTAPLGITVTQYGQSNWQGPTLTHYQHPVTAWAAADNAVKASMIDLVLDAQDEYYNRYRGLKGPVMPLHTRNYLENCSYVGTTEFNRFSWFPKYLDRERVAAWAFNGSLADITGSHDLSYSGSGPNYTTGLCQPGNTAWSNDGNANYPYHNNHQDFLFGSGDFTLEAVAKFAVVSTGTDCIASVWLGTGNQRSWALYRTGNSLGLAYSLDGINTLSATKSGINNAGAYYHLVVTRRGNTLEFFVNGESRGTASISGALYNSSGPLRIGNSPTGWPANLNGAVDWFAIYKRSMDAAEVAHRYQSIIGQAIYSAYPECSYSYAQYWGLAKVAEYWYFTGDNSVQNYLTNWMTWLQTYYRSAAKDFPTWFHDYGFGYGTYDPYITEAAARALMFYFWRSKDSAIATLLREILTDLRTNRYDSSYGGYKHDNLHWAYGNGYLTRLWGLVVNGPPPGAVNPPSGGWGSFTPTSEDISHFQALISDYWFGHAGDTSPNVLNSDLLPYTFAENYDSWSYAPHYIYVSGLGTTEGLVNVMGGALEWGRYSGNYSWYLRLAHFLLSKGFNLDSFGLAGWWFLPELPSGEIVLAQGPGYRLRLDSNRRPQLEIKQGGLWRGTTQTEVAPSPLQWYHLAGSYDGQKLTLWVNCKQAAQVTATGLLDRDSVTLTMDGLAHLQELWLFSRDITLDQVVTLFNLSSRVEVLVKLLLLEFWPQGWTSPLAFSTAAAPLQVTSREWFNRKLVAVRNYYSLGLEATEIKRSVEKASQTVRLRTQLPTEVIQLMLQSDIRGAVAVIKETLQEANHNDPDQAPITFVGTVDNWQVQNQVIQVECWDHLLDWLTPLPKRRYSYFCGHRFKGPVCGYVGTVSKCHKTKVFCQGLVNDANFGGFPNAPKLMRGIK